MRRDLAASPFHYRQKSKYHRPVRLAKLLVMHLQRYSSTVIAVSKSSGWEPLASRVMDDASENSANTDALIETPCRCSCREKKNIDSVDVAFSAFAVDCHDKTLFQNKLVLGGVCIIVHSSVDLEGHMFKFRK